MSVVSHASSPALANHAGYAERLGYDHRVFLTSEITRDAGLQSLFKYQSLLSLFAALPSRAPILLLSDDAVILADTSLEQLVGDRDWLVVRRAERNEAIIDMQVWRNTEPSRKQLQALEQAFHLGRTAHPECAVMADSATISYLDTVQGIYPLMPAGYNTDPLWARVPTFAIGFDQVPLGTSGRFTEALIEHVEQCRITGLPFLSFREQHVPDEALTVYNPGQPVAFVMLYCGSDVVKTYGALAECNYRQYCDRHGYTLYVYRALPDEGGFSGTANWFKPIVLLHALANHEWAIWVDADTLVVDRGQRIEPLLSNRTRMLAQDVGGWAFNSGVMGYRATEENIQFLNTLIAELQAVEDKSSVYASQGDQFYFIREMQNQNLLEATEVLPLWQINTPWVLRQNTSYIVHYYGMWPEMRCLMMKYDA